MLKKKVEFAIHTCRIDRDSGTRVGMEKMSSLFRQRSASIYSHKALKDVRTSSIISSDEFVSTIVWMLQEGVESMFDNGLTWTSPTFLKDNVGGINTLCSEVSKLVRKESRLVNLHGPTYIMGDLHGNLPDLIAFARSFWRQGAGFCPSNLLFLGDYVDRMKYSVEVIVYLFALKVQYPSTVFLLRGNHELRDINTCHGFQQECLRKFGEDGMGVWERFNDVFDCLPLAGLLDNAVLCVHGGIPGPECSRDIQDINNIPCPLKSDEENVLARDLMWSDPMEIDAPQDFVPNDDRGYSYKFSTTALRDYLNTNNLSLLIRAHQYKIHLGFQIQKQAQMITVFSSSAYCGGENEASCVLYTDGLVRIMRLESKETVVKREQKRKPKEIEYREPSPYQLGVVIVTCLLLCFLLMRTESPFVLTFFYFLMFHCIFISE